jgi:cytoskeleton protein RodZ
MTEVETKGGKPAVAPAAPVESQLPPAAGRSAPDHADEDGSFGRALAAAREARGLSQSDIAAQLRLNVRQVRAIEAEDLAALPEGPFIRGYVRNYARLVDLPPEPLLFLLGRRLKPTDPLPIGGGTAAAATPIQRPPREPLSGRIVIGGALAALLVFAAFGWWTMSADQRARVPEVVQSVPAANVEQPPAPAPVAPEPLAAAPVAETPSPAPEAAPASAAALASAEAALHFKFRGRSWVEVRQADGTMLMSKNNPPGTEQTIDGVPPYTVVIGNASKVDLEFRGEPVDLAAAVSRDDVARLRLE